MSDDDEPNGPAFSGPASLPRSKMQKMVKESVATGQRVAAEFSEMLYECCTELVEMISSAANEASTKENKSTIHPEHVVAALDQMGFAELKESAAAFLQQWKDEKKATRKPGRKKTAAEQAGMSEEEQIALQQKMFAEARALAVGLDL